MSQPPLYRSPMLRSRSLLLAAFATLAFSGGCATLQQVAALRNVRFALERVDGLRLAGIPLDRVTSYSALGVADVARLAGALSRGELPLDLTLAVQGLNPEGNGTDARLVRFDWTLLIEDRPTVSGIFADEVLFAPGRPATFPLRIRVDLLEFFDGGARDLANLALSLSGRGGRPTHVALRARPTIRTALGPIRYPREITILSTGVGDAP